MVRRLCIMRHSLKSFIAVFLADMLYEKEGVILLIAGAFGSELAALTDHSSSCSESYILIFIFFSGRDEVPRFGGNGHPACRYANGEGSGLYVRLNHAV